MRSTAARTSFTDGICAERPDDLDFPCAKRAVQPGSVPTKIAASGTPSAAARCSNPVSTPTTKAARAIIRATSSSGCSGRHSVHSAPPRRCLRCAAARLRCPTAAPARSRAPQALAPSFDPVRHRPFLLGPRGRVQQDDLTRRRAAHQRRAIEPEIRRPVGRVSQHLAGEHAIARDRVQRAIDAVTHVVEPRRARSRTLSRS